MEWNTCKMLWIPGNIMKINDELKTFKSLEESY